MIDTRDIAALKWKYPAGHPEAVNMLCQAIADTCNDWLGDKDESADTIKSALVDVKMGRTKSGPHLDVTLASCIWRLRIDNNRLVAAFLRDI